MLRARICGSCNTSVRFWIGPVGTPASSSVAIQCAFDSPRVTASIKRYFDENMEEEVGDLHARSPVQGGRADLVLEPGIHEDGHAVRRTRAAR